MGAYASAMVTAADREAEVARKYELLSPYLDERQQRLWMGTEAREGGHGGVSLVARAAGVARSTVTRGLFELEGGEELAGRARRPGGGRKRAGVADPGLAGALRALVEPDARGDPESPLQWTTKSVRTLADELTAVGHKVSPPTVARLLKDEGFSLQANVKVLEGRQHPDRDAQFRYINGQAAAYQASGDPVISVDAKKKELVGQYKKAGRTWRPKGQPEMVNVHDFIDKELGKVTPYGVYDMAANSGWVNVGTDHDTAQFAVSTIRTWWDKAGRQAYPGATRLLITADGGGSNGYRTRLWKTELARFASETGLPVTVCHLPPGTSKWNKVEHRLFSHISMAWRGRPLTSHEVIVETIAATTTRTGLSVIAELDTSEYPKGIKISDRQMRELEKSGALQRHAFHGEWNYTLIPGSQLRVLFFNGR
jgi:Rhodopirellula transposase DDE domain